MVATVDRHVTDVDARGREAPGEGGGPPGVGDAVPGAVHEQDRDAGARSAGVAGDPRGERDDAGDVRLVGEPEHDAPAHRVADEHDGDAGQRATDVVERPAGVSQRVLASPFQPRTRFLSRSTARSSPERRVIARAKGTIRSTASPRHLTVDVPVSAPPWMTRTTPLGSAGTWPRSSRPVAALG